MHPSSIEMSLLAMSRLKTLMIHGGEKITISDTSELVNW